MDATSADAMAFGLPAWTWSLLAFVFGLLATTWISQREHASLQQRRSDAIAEIVGRGDAAMRASLLDAEQLLRSVQTLFLASQQVSQEELSIVTGPGNKGIIGIFVDYGNVSTRQWFQQR